MNPTVNKNNIIIAIIVVLSVLFMVFGIVRLIIVLHDNTSSAQPTVSFSYLDKQIATEGLVGEKNGSGYTIYVLTVDMKVVNPGSTNIPVTSNMFTISESGKRDSVESIKTSDGTSANIIPKNFSGTLTATFLLHSNTLPLTLQIQGINASPSSLTIQ